MAVAAVRTVVALRRAKQAIVVDTPEKPRMRARQLQSAIAVVLVGVVAPRPAAGADVAVSVDYSQKVGRQATALQWGLNVFQGFDPLLAGMPGNSNYKTNVATMHPGIIRYHSWESIGDSSTRNGWWLNPTSNSVSWDAAKIAKALESSYPFSPLRMMNIPSWPDSMKDANGKLRGDQIEAFAALCAALVKIVNVDNAAGFAYWELPNERDSSALYGDDGAGLAALVVAASRAMKQVDPSIKVGGAAFTHAYIASIGDFVAAAGADIDFVSYHSYSTGDSSASDAAVWDSASQTGDSTKYVQSILEARGFPDLATFHDEYNISWAPPDPKMTNIVGAVFDALAMISMSEAGVTGAMAWNEADDWYGKLDSAWKPRPSAEIYALFNRYVVGDITRVSSTDLSLVTPFATTGSSSSALVLIHRVEGASDSVRITLAGLTPAPSAFVLHQITSLGSSDRTVSSAELSAGLTLPAPSVSVLVTEHEGDGSVGGADGGTATGGAAPAGAPGAPGAGESGAGAGAARGDASAGRASSPTTACTSAGCGGANASTPGAGTSAPRSATGCGCRASPQRAPVLLYPTAAALLGLCLGRRRRTLRRSVIGRA